MSKQQHRALMDITPRPEQVFARGQGSYLWDEQDRRYLDFVQGWAVNCLGHCPAVVVDALDRQARALINPSPAYFNRPSIALAERLTSASCFDRVFFASSGAEANEGAIKLARKFGSRYRDGASDIITFHNAFHGRTLATMSASGKAAFELLFEPKVPGFAKAVMNDLATVEALLTERTVAVMLEPILGEAGVIPADPAFMLALRELTERQGILLIVDEVQTGIGRTGRLFCYEHFQIEPDIMTLGKGIGGGVPLAALLATEQVACFEHGDQGGTYCGNPLMTAAGLAVLETVDNEEFLAEVNALSAHLSDGLMALSNKHGLGQVRGTGLLLALDLGRDIGPQLCARAFDASLLINAPNANSLRVMPALNVRREEIDQGLAILDQLLQSV